MTDQTGDVANTREISSQRFMGNVISNVAVLLLNTVVGIWFTPYLIGVLGVAVFGIATLALSISNYMGLFDSAINNAVGRYLTIHLRQKDYDRANRTFNSALGLALIISLALLPLVWLIARYSAQLFNVPTGQEGPARWVFAMTMVSYLLMVIRGVVTTNLFAKNRLDLQNGVLASNTLIRVLATVLLLSVAVVPSLIQVGSGLLLSTGASLLLAVLLVRWLTPQLRFNLRLFNRADLGILFGMSSWVFINQVGSILFLNIDQIIVNAALGATIQGMYASALQWSVLLRSLARTVSTAVAPIMVIQFAAGDKLRLTEVSVLSVKLLGVMMALPIGLISGLARPLLRVWLGPEFEELATLLVLLVLPLAINLAVLPLFSLQVAYNRVKVPGLVSLLLGVLNLILALWWVQWGRMGLGVAAASAIVLTLKNGVFTPLYAARFQQLSWFTYVPGLIISVLASLVVTAGSRWLGGVWAINGWLDVLSISAIVGAVYLPLVYFMAFTAGDRAALRRFLPQQIRK